MTSYLRIIHGPGQSGRSWPSGVRHGLYLHLIVHGEMYLYVLLHHEVSLHLLAHHLIDLHNFRILEMPPALLCAS